MVLPSMKPIRVLIVDDHEVTRVGLRTVLSREDSINIVSEAANVKDAVDEALRLQHDRELLAGRCGQDQKMILVLRIKSDSARIVLDSDRMSCWTTHCAEER